MDQVYLVHDLLVLVGPGTLIPRAVPMMDGRPAPAAVALRVIDIFQRRRGAGDEQYSGRRQIKAYNNAHMHDGEQFSSLWRRVAQVSLGAREIRTSFSKRISTRESLKQITPVSRRIHWAAAWVLGSI